jgi:inner membrane protease ATP23
MSNTSTNETITSMFKQKTKREECIARRDRAINNDPTVKFLIEKIKLLGCELPTSFFTCQKCPPNIRGGFVPPSMDEDTGKRIPAKIALCDDGFPEGQDGVNVTLAHELIHAYDHCRAKISWDSCVQHACTEVRAANLSGDCSFQREFVGRGFYAFKGQGQKCVKRRALLSVMGNPNCDEIKAKMAVDKVFDVCYQDTAPFEYAP